MDWRSQIYMRASACDPYAETGRRHNLVDRRAGVRA